MPIAWGLWRLVFGACLIIVILLWSLTELISW